MVIPKSDSIDNYMEVTPAQRSDLEKSDAAWSRPPQAFIDMWNAACGKWGTYNESTGFFELNELVDIPYDEAKAIHAAGPITTHCIALRYAYANFRTNLPIQCDSWAYGSSSDQKFLLQSTLFGSKIEVFNVSTKNFPFCIRPNKDMNHIGFGGSKLRKIIGSLDCGNIRDSSTSYNLFGSCPNLEEVRILYLRSNLQLTMPNLSYESFRYLVVRSLNRTNPITVTVHPDVFAKFNGDTSNEAAAALPEDELQKWMALSDLAATRNITFATL